MLTEIDRFLWNKISVFSRWGHHRVRIIKHVKDFKTAVMSCKEAIGVANAMKEKYGDKLEFLAFLRIIYTLFLYGAPMPI
jgi:hypothetical protein